MADEHDGPGAVLGMTLQLHVPEGATGAAAAYYGELFGRGPDFAPHDDFLEWAPIPGQEVWVQVTAHPRAEPLRSRVRFRVASLSAVVASLDARGIRHATPSQLPGVVAFVDVSDPWGNRIGYYQDLVPSGSQPTFPGSSVDDPSMFEDFGASAERTVDPASG